MRPAPRPDPLFAVRAFPPRLPEQPIFYPVTSEDYAIKIARDRNVPESGSGLVTRFEVRRDVLRQYRVQDAGGRAHREQWIRPGSWTHSTMPSWEGSRSPTPLEERLDKEATRVATYKGAAGFS